MGSKQTQEISNFKDLRLPPQVVDFFSQAGLSGGQRSALGNQMFNNLMGSLKGLQGGGGGGGGFGGGGGGGGGGRGGGGGGGGGQYFGGDSGLQALSFDDPYIQAGLLRSKRGVRANTEDDVRQLEAEAARAGGLGGRALQAYAGRRREGAQMEAEGRKDFELELQERKEGRDEAIAQLRTALEQARIAASAQTTSARIGAGAATESARISAGPAYARANLERQLAPLEFMKAFNPYAVNFGNLTPTKTTNKTSGFLPFTQGLANLGSFGSSMATMGGKGG